MVDRKGQKEYAKAVGLFRGEGPAQVWCPFLGVGEKFTTERSTEIWTMEKLWTNARQLKKFSFFKRDVGKIRIYIIIEARFRWQPVNN